MLSKILGSNFVMVISKRTELTRLAATVVFLLIGASISFAQRDSASKASQLLQIEQTLNDAVPGDSNTWKPYLDTAWYVITEDGSGLTRSAFLKGFYVFPPNYSGNIKVIKPVCIFHDQFAVVHYVADEHETILGQTLHTTYGVSDTWYSSSAGWKMLSSQVFEIPQLPPAVYVAPTDLQAFTGTYTMGEGKIAKISLQTDTLFVQKINGQPEALLPETANVFFRRSDTRGRRIFVRATDGTMTMRERRNGQDLVWRRQ